MRLGHLQAWESDWGVGWSLEVSVLWIGVGNFGNIWGIKQVLSIAVTCWTITAASSLLSLPYSLPHFSVFHRGPANT